MCPPDEIKIRERNVNHNFIIGGIFVQVNSVLIILLYDMTIFFYNIGDLSFFIE